MNPTQRAARQLVTLTLVLVAGGMLLGWVAALSTVGAITAPPSVGEGLLLGAAIGLMVSAGIAVHHTVRILFGRTPEGETLAASRPSESQDALRAAAERTLPDATSIFALVALLSAVAGGLTARVLPALGLLVVLALLAFRLRGGTSRHSLSPHPATPPHRGTSLPLTPAPAHQESA